MIFIIVKTVTPYIIANNGVQISLKMQKTLANLITNRVRDRKEAE